MDIVEDNINSDIANNKENKKRKCKEETENKKSMKTEKELQDEDYEAWKKKILEEAAAAEE